MTAVLPELIADEIPRTGNHRDRRRWCKGKRGVLHRWSNWYVAYEHVGCDACPVIELSDCQTCGKKRLRRRPA